MEKYMVGSRHILFSKSIFWFFNCIYIPNALSSTLLFLFVYMYQNKDLNVIILFSFA